MNKPTYTKIVRMLRHYPEGITYEELAELVKMPVTHVRNVVAYHRTRTGSEKFYIAGYVQNTTRGGRRRTIIALGPGTDAPAKLPPEPVVVHRRVTVPVDAVPVKRKPAGFWDGLM